MCPPFGRRTEESVEFLLCGSVTFTGSAFEPFPVDDLDNSTGVPDQLLLLQTRTCFAYSGAADSEHSAKELLRECKVITTHAIMCLQQPACTPLFHSMHGIASSGLRKLHEQSFRIPPEDVPEFLAAGSLSTKVFSLDTNAHAGYLAERFG